MKLAEAEGLESAEAQDAPGVQKQLTGGRPRYACRKEVGSRTYSPICHPRPRLSYGAEAGTAAPRES